MKKMNLVFLLLLLLIFANSTFSQTTFHNPVITGLASDPSICRAGDDYYLVTSTFEYFPGLPIYHSKDLVHWKMIGYALTRPSQDPLMGCESSYGGQYAPTIRYYDSTFYVICTNYGGQGSQGVYYVTAKNPEGPWSEPFWMNNWYVDPSLMFENDSIYYVSPDNNGSFLLGNIIPGTNKYYAPLKKIAEGTGDVAPEGPHLYKINGMYYLMSAEGGTGYQHMEVIQRSTTPWGPYVKSPINPIITHRYDPTNPFQAIGHADLVQIQDSSWWLVCLGFRPKGGNYHHIGRETFLAPVSWDTNGWPKVLPNGIVKEELAVPNLPQCIWPEDPTRDDFDSLKLRLDWNFIRNPGNFWSLNDSSGFLKLLGTNLNFTQKLSPSFIGRRQTAFNLLASAKVGFVPVTDNEEAGLVVRGDDADHFDFLITRFAKKRMVMLRQVLKGENKSVQYMEIPDGDMILRIHATDLQYSFWVQPADSSKAICIGTALTKDISTEVIGGFTGAFIGMYASGNGTNCTNPAWFEWFDFEKDPALPFSWTGGIVPEQNHLQTPENLTAAPESYEKVKLCWDDIEGETSYLIERYKDGQFITIDSTAANDTVYTDVNLTEKTWYVYRIVAKGTEGLSMPSITASTTTFPAPAPYGGVPAQIPGKIQAENYDVGQPEVVYHDNTVGNSGGKYRNDDVDLESTSDVGGGYSVGWISDNEWLTYTVDVNDSLFNVELRVASSYAGTIQLELDGQLFAQKTLPITGGWTKFVTITLKNIKIKPGKNKKLKVVFLKAGFNINWINFVAVPAVEVTESKKDSELHIFPNPSKGDITIDAGGKIFEKAEIFDVSGVKVYMSKLSGVRQEHLNSALGEGVYVLVLDGKQGQETIKFSVIR